MIIYCIYMVKHDRMMELTNSSSFVSLQIHSYHVPRHTKSSAEGEPAAFLLGYDVRVCRCQHAATARDLLRKCPSAGAAALHHDPEQQG